MKGFVKSHSKQHGYGFLEDDKGRTYFFHNTQWESLLPPVQGLRVEFEAEETEKGLRAERIRRIK